LNAGIGEAARDAARDATGDVKKLGRRYQGRDPGINLFKHRIDGLFFICGFGVSSQDG
jgi:hypothetical protein